MSIMSNIQNNKPYDEPVYPEQKPSRYVYHFHFPINSIDVRKITEEEMQTCKIILDFYNQDFDPFGYVDFPPGATLENYDRIKKMFKEHFPEELI